MNFLYNFSIHKRLFAVVIAFMLPVSILAYQLLDDLNEEIRFTELEIKGVTFEKPLLLLLDEIANYQIINLLAKSGDDDAKKELADSASTIEKIFSDLTIINKKIGADLDFTAEGLARHQQSSSLTVEALYKKWGDVKNSSNSAELYKSILADLLAMISHLSNTSNLIIDVDLDSSYLMNSVVEAAPQMLVQLAKLKSSFFTTLQEHGNQIPLEDRSVMAFDAGIIENSYLKKLNDDINTAFKEDANFNAVSASLQSSLTPKLADYNNATKDLLKAINSVIKGENMSSAKFIEIANISHDGTSALAQAVIDELHKMLEIRAANLKQDRLENILFASAAILFAIALFVILTSSVTQPLRKLQEVMLSVTEGKFDVEVDGQDNADETGEMARCVEKFRQAGLEKLRLEEEAREKDKRTAEEKKQTMLNIANSFENKVQVMINSVAAGANELSHTVESMKGNIEDVGAKASSVSSSAQRTAQNVNTVASASEEMSASVKEISTQMTKSTQVVNEAVGKADNASISAKSLENATLKMGDIVQLISDIAEQINLLALNATIESARAGEAGKGFAVVASEVKNLAGQTTKATQEIATQIEAVQAVSAEVAGALNAIKQSVDNVNQYSGGIASAVEEQSATTNEIAHNMQIAAQGTKEISDHVNDITVASNQANAASIKMQDASKSLAKEAEQLNSAVAVFLSEIREG